MNLYNQAFEEALNQNAINEEKWINYKNNVNETRENVNTFLKSYKLDILVPLGKKAFIRGTLQHTNDILVSHSSNYFSLVSNYQANELLDYRNGICVERLKNLDKEKELFLGKLDAPRSDLFSENEIIEEYNEEAEKEWRIRHRESIKKFKSQEAEERRTLTDQEISNMLDQYELMEEMADELESLEESQNYDYEALLKMASVDTKPQDKKKRMAHDSAQDTIENVHSKDNHIEKSDGLDADSKESIARTEHTKAENDDVIEGTEEKENIKSKRKIKRKVRFSTSLEDVKIIEEPKHEQQQSAFPPIEIKFHHSTEIFNSEIYDGLDDGIKFKHPGDIFGKVLNDLNAEHTKKKSILKETNYKFDKNNLNAKTQDVNDDDEVFETLSKFPLICGEVIERQPENEKIISDVKSGKKVSKFKELRSKVQ